MTDPAVHFATVAPVDHDGIIPKPGEPEPLHNGSPWVPRHIALTSPRFSTAEIRTADDDHGIVDFARYCGYPLHIVQAVVRAYGLPTRPLDEEKAEEAWAQLGPPEGLIGYAAMPELVRENLSRFLSEKRIHPMWQLGDVCLYDPDVVSMLNADIREQRHQARIENARRERGDRKYIRNPAMRIVIKGKYPGQNGPDIKQKMLDTRPKKEKKPTRDDLRSDGYVLLVEMAELAKVNKKTLKKYVERGRINVDMVEGRCRWFKKTRVAEIAAMFYEPPKGWLSVSEVCKMLNMPYGSFYEYMVKNKLEVVKVKQLRYINPASLPNKKEQ